MKILKGNTKNNEIQIRNGKTYLYKKWTNTEYNKILKIKKRKMKLNNLKFQWNKKQYAKLSRNGKQY